MPKKTGSETVRIPLPVVVSEDDDDASAKEDHLVNEVLRDIQKTRSFQNHKKGVAVTRFALEEMLKFVRTLETKNKLQPEVVTAILLSVVRQYENNLPAIETKLALPVTAPERWVDRDLNRRENAPMFIRRVYGDWLGRGLERKDLAKLDNDLYKALSVWLSRHPEDEMATLLPSQSDLVDNLIDRLTIEYPVSVLRKLGYAIDSRLRRNPELAGDL